MRFDSQDSAMNGRFGFGSVIESVGEVVTANPAAAGGVTAFAVAMTFFTANAIYFQDRPHPSAFFETRPYAARDMTAMERTPVQTGNTRPAEPGRTRIVLTGTEDMEMPALDRLPVPAAPVRQSAERTIERAHDDRSPGHAQPSGGEPQIAGIQELLAKLGYYEGDVDGLKGPMTDAAIEAYKDKAGLRGIELTDAELLLSIRNNLDVTAAIPAPVPAHRPGSHAEEKAAEPPASDGVSQTPSQIPSPEVVKVQAALKAFGNADVTVDGIAGAQTEAAIREFQTLFRLPVTGEIDGPLLDKMREVGLIQ